VRAAALSRYKAGLEAVCLCQNGGGIDCRHEGFIVTGINHNSSVDEKFVDQGSLETCEVCNHKYITSRRLGFRGKYLMKPSGRSLVRDVLEKGRKL
jgi:hypothetical protein